MDEFRTFMFNKIYHSAELEPDRKKAKYIICKLFEYYISNPRSLPEEFLEREERWDLQTVVIDYIAGLTDLYAIKQFEKLFIPAAW